MTSYFLCQAGKFVSERAGNPEEVFLQWAHMISLHLCSLSPLTKFKNWIPLRAVKILLRKKMDHTTVSAIKASSVTL